ncbi:MAG TPA: haloacid dehalogenase, partial [Burkholderiaceae bacterium]
MVAAALHLPTPRAVLFDVYGTLFDVYSVGARAEALFPGSGERLALLWRDKQIEYSRLVSMSRRYRPFSELTQCALQFACARLNLELTTDARDALIGEYQRLKPFT